MCDWCFCRGGQPAVEFIFAATEEAIFVHVIISAKYVKFTPYFVYWSYFYSASFGVLIVFTAMHVELIFLFLSVSRHIRSLSSGDIERVLKRSSNNPGYKLPGLCILYAGPLFPYLIIDAVFC
jgi:hypothetical protein